MFLTIASLLLASCAKPPVLHAEPGREFTLRPGQVAIVGIEDMAIEFVSVVVDSRRPIDKGASRAGEVSCLLLLTRLEPHARPYRALLTQPGGASTPEIQMVDGRELLFEVEPGRSAEATLNPGAYQLKMTVLKRARTACAQKPV